MGRARIALQRYREERREAVRQYVGHHWSEEGTEDRVPVNLLSLYISVIGRNLIAKNPRVMLSTFDRQHKPAVSAMQSWANQEMKQMRLASTLQRVVLDALFSIGICKVALATPADSAGMAWQLPAGQPFAQHVDLDDFVFDIHARSFEQAGFIGHRYRVPLEVVRDSKIYSKARKDLTASDDALYNVEGDERIGVLGRGVYAGDSEEFEEFVDLWEVYIPRHKLVYTLADNDLAGATPTGTGGAVEPLRVQKWLGPDQGPYRMLGYGIVPGNAMPKGPIQDLIDLHESVNGLYRKADRQGQRQKEVLLVAGGAMEDGSRIQQANDGDIIRSDNPERAKVAGYGGANQSNLQLGIHFKDLFMMLGGNIEMMGGLAPQSKTLGQDQMLQQNASGQVAEMQKATVDFTAGVVESLCWYWWKDPFKVMKVGHSLPGLPDMSITRQVGPKQRMGRFEDLQIEIDPYSMQHSTPQGRLAALNQVVQQTIMPMMQLLQQQGISFDLNAYLKKVAEYLDMPDLADIISIQEPPAPAGGQGGDGGGGGDAPGMPAQTKREYVRRSLGGDTAGNREQSMLNGTGISGNGQQNGKLQTAGA
jgi:hypothetical protein